MEDKVAVFIDGGYVRAILKKRFNELPIDYLKFSEELCKGCERFRTYYYNCPPYQSPSPTPEERRRKSDYDRFIEKLRCLPRFEIREGRLMRTKDPQHEFVQKGVDVLLSIDLTQVSASRVINRAILVSADSDFVPAVQRAKENLVLVTLAYFPPPTSQELYRVCDERFEITEDLINRCALNAPKSY
ncbi:MAG: NYN domain-containing protein [Candidatus Methanomethylicaceae archaeon]